MGEHNRTIWTLSVVPLGGRHLAHYNYQDGKTYFVHSNGLGSTSQVTDPTGTLVVEDQLFYAFGQNWTMAGAMQEDRFAQLGHRDTETSLDPTPNRMFASTQGRWMIPDPLGGDILNPQSLNRYAYVLNKPTVLTDPKGLCPPFWWRGHCTDTAESNNALHLPSAGGRASLDACGVDPFCNQAGGIGPFGSPVAQIDCDGDGHCMTGSWAFSRYNVGGVITVDWAAQKQAEIQSAVNIFTQQAKKDAAALGVSLEEFLDAQNIANPDKDQPFLKGGNWNFLIPHGAQIPANCTSDGRCGDFPSLHFGYPDRLGKPQFVHLDTANVWRRFPLGAVVHGFVDFLLGNTLLATGIPR